MEAVVSKSNESPVTWGQIFRICLAIFWRLILGVCIFSLIFGALFSIFIPESVGATLRMVFCFALGFVFGLLLEIYVFKMVIGKKFGSFILSIASNVEVPVSGRTNELAANNLDIIRIWWAYRWRGISFIFLSSLLAFLVGAIFIHLGTPLTIIKPFINPILIPADIFVGWIFPLKVIFGKKFHGFRLAILTY